MKKIISFALCLLVLFGSVNALAYTFPDEFWEVNNKYEDALKRKDHPKIIEYGTRIIEIMKNEPEVQEKKNILVARYNQLGFSYAELKDYPNSAKMFENLYNYASRYGDEYYEYVKGAAVRIDQYKPAISMYTDKGTAVYYGAKNEKANGVLFGLCANGETRKQLSNESMVLTYQELGQGLLGYNVNLMKTAKDSGVAVEFALNCPNEGLDIKNIRKMDSYLGEISELIAGYPAVPVYLRFAAEFDVWTVQAAPEEFKYAFRYVSNYFKTRNSNVAMVWSPNQASNWYIDIDDYYPGDEYVDWVGISLYSQKYFLGDKYQDENNEIAFKTGINSDPVVAVKDIVEKYGNRKPIMISESGCGHKLVGSGEDTSDFAMQRLDEVYCYLPMVYPQIKLIAYFDWYVENNEETDDFRLCTNKNLQSEYLKLVKGQRFIQDGYNSETGYCYRPVYNGMTMSNIFEVSCYAHSYGTNVKTVTYSIDGKYAGMANQIPFTAFVDASAYSGKHKLKAVALFENGQTLTTESDIYIKSEKQNISVEISNKKIDFDREPVLYNDRTMVPMRKIFEELGATVNWDGNTQTATGKKGDRTVQVTVGQNVMYVNGNKVQLDVAPIILNDRTLVPVRAVSEGLGCNVKWDSVNYTVSITPKNLQWSEWSETLPKDVNSGSYYIEEKTEYRFRTRELEYFTLKSKNPYAMNYVRTDVSYGSWSSWQDEYIAETSERQVETRTNSTPKKYHYAHYCTGNISDKENRYRTWDRWWHEECKYHDLGWFDSPLPYSEDSTSNYAYYVDGKKYRCSNTCFRWYLIETSGGSYTQYRYRKVYEEHIYCEWGDWSGWSYWSGYNPLEYYRNDGSVDVDQRTLYRYKEK